MNAFLTHSEIFDYVLSKASIPCDEKEEIRERWNKITDISLEKASSDVLGVLEKYENELASFYNDARNIMVIRMAFSNLKDNVRDIYESKDGEIDYSTDVFL